MKSIAPAAMAAIEAGEAIVTGAVEIVPRPNGTSQVINVASNVAGVPVTINGFSASDVLTVTKPLGLTYQAWSRWAVDGDSRAAGLPWHNDFWVIDDIGGVTQYWFGAHEGDGDPTARYATAAEAESAFIGESVLLTGSTSYTFSIQQHTPITDDRGGLSLRVESDVVFASEVIRVWGGYGPILIEGETYQGIGDRGLAQQTAGAIGGFAQGLTLTLSGIEPHLLSLLDADEVKGASVVLRRLIFASDGKTLLDASVFDRGRVDAIETSEVVGAGAAIILYVETAARGLGSSGARQRSDSDQRLINPSDGYFKFTAYAGEKMLYWGGRKPRTGGSALGGSSSGSGFFGAFARS